MGSVLLTIGLGEAALWVFWDEARVMQGLIQTHLNHRAEFIADTELGFRPILDGPRYDAHGVLRNEHALAKRPGVSRLLFIGDSVTHRGKIVHSLRQAYGTDRYEYWNAGVESYSLTQVLTYFERYNHAIGPDHVIYTLHNNDFLPTPVTFADGQGRLQIVVPGRPLEEPNGWLLRHSRIYRRWLLWQARGFDAETMMDDAEQRLRAFRDRLGMQGVRLSVIVLPILAPPERWSERERASRERSLEMLEGGGFRWFDLHDALEEGLRAGIELQQSPGDTWHPSDAAAQLFAAALVDAGLLP